MASGSWWRRLGGTGSKGSWRRRYAEGRGVTPGPGPWPRQTVEEEPPAQPGTSGSWDRRLGGSGAKGSWARRSAESTSGYAGNTGGDATVQSGANEVVVIPIVPPVDSGGSQTPVYVTALRIRIASDHSGGNRKVKPVIYKGDNTKVIAGQELTITAAMAGTEQDLVLTTPALLDGTWYIGIAADGTISFLADSAGVSLVAADTYADGVADTLGSTSNRAGKLAVAAIFQSARPSADPIVIGGSPTTSATEGDFYSFTPTISGGYAPYSWAGSNLMSGTSVDAHTGTLSGTLTTAQSKSPSLTVTDAIGQQMSFLLGTVTVAAAYTPAYAVVNMAAHQSTAGGLAYGTEVTDSANIWSSGAPTRLTVPAGITFARIAAADIGVLTTPMRMDSYKNGAAFVGKSMGGGYSDNAQSSGMAASAIFGVTAGDYLEIINPPGGQDVAASQGSWATFESIDPSKGRGLFTHASTQSISASTWTKLSFDTETFDTLGAHDPTTNNQRITPPAGLFRLGAGAEIGGNANNYMIRITRNGTDHLVYHNVQANGANGRGISAWTYPIVTNGTDYFEVFVYQDNGTQAVQANTGVWFCYEELPSGLKYAVLQQSGGGDAVGTNTDEELLWGGEIADTDGFHSTSSNTGRLIIPSGLGITKARLSFGLQGGGANTGNRTLCQCKRASGNIAGLPRQACQTSLANVLSGFGGWIDATAGDQFFLGIYGGARTFAPDAATWFAIECR